MAEKKLPGRDCAVDATDRWSDLTVDAKDLRLLAESSDDCVAIEPLDSLPIELSEGLREWWDASCSDPATLCRMGDSSSGAPSPQARGQCLYYRS